MTKEELKELRHMAYSDGFSPSTANRMLDEIERLSETVEVLRDNMHQALGGYMSVCPECDGRLPKHSEGCALRQALDGAYS